MYIRNRGLSIVFKLILIFAGIMGLLGQFGILDGVFKPGMLKYFTILSNILCILYFTADVIYIIKGHGCKKTTWCPALKGIAMMGITITMLVAHFILKMGFSMGSASGLSLLAVHYIVPLMTIADWLLFDEKGSISIISPFIWTAFPLAYFAYSMIAAQVLNGMEYITRYPYPFINVDLLGWSKVLHTVLILTAFFIALGYFYYAVDKIMKKADCRADINKPVPDIRQHDITD